LPHIRGVNIATYKRFRDNQSQTEETENPQTDMFSKDPYLSYTWMFSIGYTIPNNTLF